MSNTSKGIPYVPEGTLDPAAGINDALKVINALVIPVVASELSAPPGSPADGQAHIVGDTATGAWAGHETEIAYYAASVWQFLIPKTGWKVENVATGGTYRFTEGTPGTWLVWSPTALPGLTESGTARDATAADAGHYIRFTNAAAKTYTFDPSEGYLQWSEYEGRNVGAGDLTLVEAGGMTINLPTNGSLVIPQGGSYVVKIVDTDEADLIAVTVAP